MRTLRSALLAFPLFLKWIVVVDKFEQMDGTGAVCVSVCVRVRVCGVLYASIHCNYLFTCKKHAVLSLWMSQHIRPIFNTLSPLSHPAVRSKSDPRSTTEQFHFAFIISFSYHMENLGTFVHLWKKFDMWSNPKVWTLCKALSWLKYTEPCNKPLAPLAQLSETDVLTERQTGFFLQVCVIFIFSSLTECSFSHLHSMSVPER